MPPFDEVFVRLIQSAEHRRAAERRRAAEVQA
jgi:hypothetical protein